MMYVGGVFVDLAEVSKILSVNCGFYPFRNGILFFENHTLSPNLNINFLYPLRGFLYRIETKPVFLTSLGDFPKDLMTRQFFVDINCGE